MVARVSKAPQKEGMGASNSANLSHDASCFFPKSSHHTEEADENAYKTPVVSRKTSAAEAGGGMRTPDLGHFTRSVIQSLENIKFTPSQGICTPSPTILVHHHHHVYGATTQGPSQEDQISNAYLAGLAAGRADAERKLKAGHPLIPAAMYESPSASIRQTVDTDGAGNGAGCDGAGTGMGEDCRHGDEDDAKSLDGRGPDESETRPPRADADENGKNKGKTTHHDGKPLAVDEKTCKTTSSRRSASPTKKPPNRPKIEAEGVTNMAFALMAAHGIHSEDIPSEVRDLASLLITLEIPAELMMTPASEFSGHSGRRKRLNARQRRTLRRSQERAWKELETLKAAQPAVAPAHITHDVRRTYSPTCLNYGVNPVALAEYNGYAIAPHAMVQMHSPGAGPYLHPVAYPVYGHSHPEMANFAPVHGHPYGHGHMHGHTHTSGHQQGQQRTLSRFADR